MRVGVGVGVKHVATVNHGPWIVHPSASSSSSQDTQVRCSTSAEGERRTLEGLLGVGDDLQDGLLAGDVGLAEDGRARPLSVQLGAQLLPLLCSRPFHILHLYLDL